ncbi:MAG TPA: GlmU family protein [Bacteroidales bacterium]|nr:GlmU family protein [Bacteroidales bacterium]
MNYIFYDNDLWEELLPLTFTKPIAELRVGILKISEKWQKHLNASFSYATKEHLQKKYPISIGSDNIVINGAVLPNTQTLQVIQSLSTGQSLYYNDTFIACRLNQQDTKAFVNGENNFLQIRMDFQPTLINHFCKIFSLNGEELESDFELITKDRKSQPLSSTNKIIGSQHLLFIEEGAKVEASIINTHSGPVYIGKDAEIMEGCLIRGPFAICEHATLKMGAKIYGATTIGPHSKVGGEVNNSVIIGYSNKAHDGFLGNSVIGEWCNLGADTNNSNLKNNYEMVKMWNYPLQKFVSTQLQFAGLIMGDHSKCGINTMFNTGTVVGVACNLFGDGFHRNFVPSFSWGGAQGYTHYRFEKAIETAKLVYQRRNLTFDKTDEDILAWIYKKTEQFRNY